MKGYRPCEYGDPNPGVADSYTQDTAVCEFPGCGRPRRQKGNGLLRRCAAHQRQRERNGVLKPLRGVS